MYTELKTKILQEYEAQWRFAKVANINESSLSRIIRRELPVSIEKQREWAKLLNTRPEELFPQ